MWLRLPEGTISIGCRFVCTRDSAIRRRKMITKSLLRNWSLCAVTVAGLALSACGTTPGDRAVSGGLIGAGAGAAIGSVTGSAGKGAVIGGLGGAANGA